MKSAILWAISAAALLAAPAFGQTTLVEELPGGRERPLPTYSTPGKPIAANALYGAFPTRSRPTYDGSGPSEPSSERYSVFVNGAGEGPVDAAGKPYGRRGR